MKLDLNEEAGFRAEIEQGINFSREDYSLKVENSSTEMVDYDQFIKNVAQACYDNDGTVEDAIFIANDAYSNL
ncbi:MAG: hypothetical protein WCT06_09150 [Armatimonadota bacterium]|jgi:hypothetical protein|nr:hypothetical protein [Bacteroidales bacterium]